MVEQLLHVSRPSKSPAPDDIYPRVPKELDAEVTAPVMSIIR